MHLFYTPLISPGMDAFLLDEAESKHAIRVLRLGVGTEVRLVDGIGGYYEAEIQDAHPKRVVLAIKKAYANYQRLPYQLHVGIAPTKNMERLEWFIEKATEIGITEITPLICDRSERKEVKTERLEKVAVSAMKQSMKAFLPKINDAVRLSSWMEKLGDAETVNSPKRFIAHCDEGDKSSLTNQLEAGEDALILIGPEGDFSPAEIQLAKQKDFHPITLGTSRLRTETAGLAACMEIALLNR